MTKKDNKTATGEPFLAKVEIKHEFTQEEWKAKTDLLTRKMKDVEIRTEAMDSARATAKAEVKALAAEVNDVANQLRNGYEARTVEAFVKFNRRKGVKSFFYNSPGTPEHKKLIRQEAMSEDDYEQLVPLPPQPEALSAPAADQPTHMS